MDDQATLIEMTTDIIAAYVGHNTVRASELPELISTVYAALGDIKSPKPVEAQTPTLSPAVSVKKSVTEEYIVCLDDGKKFKSLRRHLAVLGMTPEEYRAKWGLPRDYPMTAPGYAAKRSELAKATGLGSARRKVVEKAQSGPAAAPEPANDAAPIAPRKQKAAAMQAEPAEVVTETPVEAPVRRRGRPKKAA